MKNYFKPYVLLVLISFIFNCQDLSAQLFALKTSSNGNVGLGIDDPMQKLDINGVLKIGTTNTLNAGTIRFKDQCFQGYDGSNWISLSNSDNCTPTSSMTYSFENEDSLIPQLIDLERQAEKLNKKLSSDQRQSSFEFDLYVELKNNVSHPILHQNAPNPYFDYTDIKVSNLTNSSQARLVIKNIHGQNLHSIPLSPQENVANITVRLNLPPGLYFYSLIVDGDLISTKKMIKAR